MKNTWYVKNVFPKLPIPSGLSENERRELDQHLKKWCQSAHDKKARKVRPGPEAGDTSAIIFRVHVAGQLIESLAQSIDLVSLCRRLRLLQPVAEHVSDWQT